MRRNEATLELDSWELAGGNGIAKGRYSRHNESEKSERYAEGIDGGNGEPQTMVPNNIMSRYLK